MLLLSIKFSKSITKFQVQYSAKDAAQSVKLMPSGWLGALPRWTTKSNRLKLVIFRQTWEAAPLGSIAR